MKINKALISATLLLVGMSSSSLLAAKEQTIGFIDREQIMAKTLHAREIQDSGKKQFKSRIDNAESKKKQFLSEQEALERDRDVLTAADVKKRTEKLQADFTKLGAQEEELSQEIEAFQMKATKKLDAVFKEVVAQLAKENNLDIVFPSELAMHGSKKFDYTFRAIELMDKSFKESKS